jgi:hypothetical protein
MFDVLKLEINNSYIEKGDYQMKMNYTLDAEALQLSQGILNPV